MPDKTQGQMQPAPQEQQLEPQQRQEQPQEEEGLTPGTQAAIGVLFLGLPFLGMGVEMLGWGETGLVLAALATGSMGLGAKVLIDRGRNPQVDDAQIVDADGQEPGRSLPGRSLALPHLGILDRLQNANWGALLRPMNEGELPQLPAPAAQVEQQTESEAKTLMNFGETLKPDPNKIFSGRKVVIGVSDAGKSNTVAVIAEEIGGPEPRGFAAPLFLLDTEDEYRKLCDKKYLARPLWMDSSKLTPDNAFQFAQWAVHHLRQVIVNLQSYEDHEAAWVIINLIRGVQAYEEANDVRLPCEFILDEATVWLPQVRAQSTLNRFMVDDPYGNQVDEVKANAEDEEDEDQDEDIEEEKGKDKSKQVSLLSVLERTVFSVIVRRGRKRGMGFTLACQRIAEINKSALQANWTILMRQTQAADFREYKKFGIAAKEAMELQAGEAFIYPPGKPREQHRFRLRYSPHGAKTPGLDELRKHQQRLASSGQPSVVQPQQPAPSAPAPTRKELPEQRAALPGGSTPSVQNRSRRGFYVVPPLTEEPTMMEDLVPNPRLRRKETEQIPLDERDVDDAFDEDEDELEDEDEETVVLTEREQLYEKVLLAWARNIRSIRPMQAELGLNFNQTRELLEEMDGLGLITWRSKGEKAGV